MIPFAYLRAAAAWAILTFVITTNLSAQRYTYRQYGSQDGLTNLTINCLLQDRTGYLWVGTDNGLFRYDGGSFRHFGHAEGLPNAEIRSLAESPEGILWVATTNGAALGTARGFRSLDTGESGSVRTVAFDRRGRVYLEYLSGIVRGVPDGVGSYRFHRVVSGATSSVSVNGDDVWFGKDGDLWHLVGDKAERMGSPLALPFDRWDAVAKDAHGNLWVRSLTRLYCLPSGQAQFVNRSEGIPTATDTRLYADRHGRVLVSSESGVVVLNGPNRIDINAKHGLPGDAVRPVLLDRDESLWMGMLGGGLVRLLGHGEWLSWKKDDGLPDNTVWAIRHDQAGRVWVGTSRGLSILSQGNRMGRTWTRHNGLAGDWVTAIAEGPTGDLFVATDPTGISHFSKQGVLLRTYGPASGLTGDYVFAIAVDRQRHLWVGGSGGCFRSRAALNSTDELKFEHMDIPGIAAGMNAQDLLIDENGIVWVATSRGLARFQNGRWNVFTHADGLKADNLETITQGQGALWLAYRDSLGITRVQIDGDHLKTIHFTAQKGLSSDQVFGLAFDPSGRLWATTDNGVDVYEQGRWRHYGKDDGLIWEDTDSHALHADREGNVWVGTSNGLSRYTAPPYPIPDSPPTVVLTSVEGVSQEFHAGDQPILPYARSSLRIRFGSLNYSYETRTRFRYRLSGYESDWHETRERSVHFAGLPAGHYVFEVAALDPNGVWNQAPTRFKFSIKPPWWQSWWFVTACLLMTVLAGGALWRLRLRALVAQKEHLEQQVAERTAELRESRQQLWAAMDAAKLGIWRQTRIAGEHCGNEKAPAVFGGAASEVIAFEKLLSFVVPEDRERFKRIVTQRNQKQKEATPTFEYRVNLSGGSICWLQVRGGSICDDSGTSMCAAGVVMDITEQKRAEHKMHALEQQLRQTQKMEAVGRLAGGIAHDFNNLLMVIQSYTEMLQDSLPDQDSLRNNTEQVLKAADRGASLTKQLLAFSRKQVLSPVVLDLNAVVGEAATMLKRLIGEHIELRVNAVESLWAVKADPDQITQVLVNLCVNARDAMLQGGTLTIATSNVAEGDHPLEKYPDMVPGDYVLLSVADTGTGISKDVQEQIFEPFFTTKERGKGTGLGLPSVFGIVKQSGGYVWVDSEPGHGACFAIYLPRVKEAIASDICTKAEARPRGTETILVAEDEKPLREALCHYLRSLGYTVFAAGSGHEALSVASQIEGHIDLLITDVIMPKMNGRELSETLAILRPDLKIIYMSGYTDDAIVRYCVGEKSGAFLQKPFNLAMLALKVRDMLGSTRALR